MDKTLWAVLALGCCLLWVRLRDAQVAIASSAGRYGGDGSFPGYDGIPAARGVRARAGFPRGAAVTTISHMQVNLPWGESRDPSPA